MMKARHDDDFCISDMVDDGIWKFLEHQVAILRFDAGKGGWRATYSSHGQIHRAGKFNSKA